MSKNDNEHWSVKWASIGGLVFGAVGALTGIAGLIFSFITSNAAAGRELNIANLEAQLQRDLAESQLSVERRFHEYDVARNAYIPRIDGDAVVLVGGSTNDRRPDSMTVTPIFMPKSGGQPVVGSSFPVPVSIGEVGDDFSEIRFGQILDAVCEYEGNAVLCGTNTIDQLIVRYSIDGFQRSGVAEVPQS